MTNDFLIIGGGIAGISLAARLSHLGRVTVLEAEPALAYHASGRSAALFDESYGKPAVVALNRASKDYHMTANGGVTAPRGLLVVARASDRAVFEADVAAMGLARLTPLEARAMVPILNPNSVQLAAHHGAAWDLDTDLLIQNFARELRHNGGSIVTGARVEKITRTATGWTAHSAKAAYCGRILVNAAGAWVDQVAQLAGVAPLGFTAYRRSMARIPAPGGHDLRRWPMIFGAGEGWYAKPDAGKLLVSPAEEDPMPPHDAWPDDMVLAEGLARYEEMVTEPVTRVEHRWAGLRTFAPDRCLVVGFDPREPAFFWQAGQGGYGFQTAPAASQLGAELIGGHAPDLPPEVIAALSPARFG